MILEKLPHELSICKANGPEDVDLSASFYFVGKTDEEYSLVCPTKDVPAAAVCREDGWRSFRIQGVLDLSLIGILSKILSVLAEEHIGIFAVSTFNTDYILVRAECFDRAAEVLEAAGYTVR